MCQEGRRGCEDERPMLVGLTTGIGKVAAARKLLTLVYYGLRDGHIRCLAKDAA